jgi:hypothetical protein
VCLAVIILTYVWRFQDLFSVVAALEITTLVSVGALGLFFFGSHPERTLSHARHRVTTALLVIFVLALFSVPFGLYPGRTLNFITADLLKNLLIFLVLTSSIRSLGELKRFLLVFIGGAVTYSLYVNLTVSTGPGGRLHALYYYDSNDLAFALVTTLPMVVFFFLRPRTPKLRLLALGAMALIILLIVKTGSRGGFIGLVAVSGFLLFLLKEVSVRARVGVVVLGLAGMMVFAGQAYWENMSSLLNPTEDYNWSGQSEAGRMAVWKRGMGYMFKYPVFGVGARNFQIAEGDSDLSELAADRRSIGRGWKWSTAHNSFVQIGAELGVFALIAFCVALFSAFRAAYGGSRDPPGGEGSSPVEEDYRLMGQVLAAALIGYAVTGFFLSQAFSALLYVLLALIVAYARLRPEAAAVAPPEVLKHGRRPVWGQVPSDVIFQRTGR